LIDGGVHERSGHVVQDDGAIERIANDVGGVQALGPAFLIAAGTASPNFWKFSVNMPTSFLACAS
jgi:hypothetical protein